MENHLNAAINNIKTLRANVGEVFNALANGSTEDQGDETKETNFLIELQDLLNLVNQNVR